MSYFGGSGGMRGDPGFFDTLGKIGGAIFKATPIGGAITGIRDIFTGGTQPPPRATPPVFVPPTFGGAGVPSVGVPPGIARRNGGAAPKTVVVDVETGMVRAKRRRMNVGNPRALRRAIRRTDGFVTLARGALKNTGFKIVSKSSGRVSRATMDKAVAAAHHSK